MVQSLPLFLRQMRLRHADGVSAQLLLLRVDLAALYRISDEGFCRQHGRSHQCRVALTAAITQRPNTLLLQIRLAQLLACVDSSHLLRLLPALLRTRLFNAHCHDVLRSSKRLRHVDLYFDAGLAQGLSRCSSSLPFLLPALSVPFAGCF